jgi:peptidyl-prolyl cis-trans isomerase C
MRRRLLPVLPLVLVAACVAATSACPRDPRAGSREPVVTIGKTVVVGQQQALSLFAQHGVARVAPELRPVVAQQVLQGAVDEHLMLQAAATSGLSVTDEAVDREVRSRTEGYPPGTFLRVLGAEQLTVDAFREGVKQRLLQDALLRARLSTLPAITDAEVEARYAATLAKQEVPEQVRARHILLRTPEEARHVVEQVRTRQLTFEDAARRFSQGMEANEGGDLGWFARGDLPKVFDTCFSLEQNVVADAVASNYGFHVFLIVDKRPARIEPLSAVREKILDELTREQQAEAADALMAELRKATPAVVDTAALERVLTLLPAQPPSTPAESVEQGTGTALDSHLDGADPLPALRRE